MRKIKKAITIIYKNFVIGHRSRSAPSRFVQAGIPYYSQWESPELAEAIVSLKLQPEKDPAWRSSGAETKEEYAYWSMSCCGMACLKMMLAATSREVVPTVTLAKECFEYGGYVLPLESSVGLIYIPFIRFIKDRFGLEGRIVAALTFIEIKQALARGEFVMASVSRQMPMLASVIKKGGHLILVTGYDDEKSLLSYHDPARFSGSGNYSTIGYKEFQNYFDNKGIIISDSIKNR